MRGGAVIPQGRTAVPVELDRVFDSLHHQAEALGRAAPTRTGPCPGCSASAPTISTVRASG